MEYKISKKLFTIFSFFLFFGFIFKQSMGTNPDLSFPFATFLSNDNIFVIHQDGVSIYDSTFSNLISDEIVFTSSYRIQYEYHYRMVTISKFEDGTIISIINNKIYIFDYKGSLIFESSQYITEYSAGQYYSIVPIKFYDGYYYYFVGFADESVYYFYYKFNLISKENQLIQSDNSIYVYPYYSFSCQLMNYDFTTEVINCFFISNSNSNKITVYDFSFSETNIALYKQFLINTNINNIKYIKSVVNYSGTKSFVCFLTESSLCYCFKYETNDIINEGINIQLEEVFTNVCGTDFSNMRIEYIKGKEELIVSCIGSDKSIFINVYDNNLNLILSENKYTDCSSITINGHSILYSPKTNKYYDLSDVVCSGDKYPFNKLVEEEEEESPIEIITTVPTTLIETTIPKIIIETTILTTLVETTIPTTLIETTIPTTLIETTIPTTLIETTIPTTLVETTIIESTNIEIENKEENEKADCNELEKCLKCNEESVSMNLCIKCNEGRGFYLLNNGLRESSYIDCVNEDTKPSGFYLDRNTKKYEACYYSCATCDYGGNIYENNCTSCEVEHVINKKKGNAMNCDTNCQFLYYYNTYDKYKCTSSFLCPENAPLLIKNKKKCIDICSKDDTYKYQYNGECLLICPENTIENDYLCQDIISEKCILSEREYFDSDKNITENEIELLSKNYAKEFNYTDNHLSLFKNEIYSIGFYKNSECLSETSFPNIDFGDCYKKVQSHLETNKNLIIGIIDKKINNPNRQKVSTYSLIDPDSGETLNVENLCKNDLINVKENISSLLANTNNDINSLMFLLNNDVDVFNLSSPFYTDICYYFDSPFKKDISLNDRITMIFPNVTLCDTGCEVKGVDPNSMEAICECKFKNLFNQDFLGEDILMENPISEITDIISETNLLIIKCYKRFFTKKYISQCYGGFIVIGLIIIQIILTIIYCTKSLYLVRKYLFSLGNKFYAYLSVLKNNNNLQNPPKNNKNNKIDTEMFTSIEKFTKNKKQISRPYSNNSLNTYGRNQNKIRGNIIDIKSDNNKNNKTKKINKLSSKFRIIKKISSSDISPRNDSPPTNLEFVDEKKQNNQKTNIKSKDSFKEIEEFLSPEIDDMNFDDVIKNDKRTFKEFFFDRLKENQIIINTILVDEPLKPKTMKIILLIIDISLFFFINGLFYNENYISEIFHLKEKDKFFSFVTRSIKRFLYTTLVSVIISYLIDFFFVDEEKNIKRIFKRENNELNNIQYEMVRIAKNIKKRYTAFIIISFVINIIILYYIFLFNNIYYYSKVEWIKSSLVIILIMQLLPILVCLLETIIRFIGIKTKSEKIYKLSLYLS